MATKFGRFRDFGEWACRKGEGRFFTGCLKLKLVPAYAGSFGAAATKGWAVYFQEKDSGSRVQQLTKTARLPPAAWPGQRLADCGGAAALLDQVTPTPSPACLHISFRLDPVLQGCTMTTTRLMAVACSITSGMCLCSAVSVSGQDGQL
jgi:hypothetical protein